jgi:hypothetical protein
MHVTEVTRAQAGSRTIFLCAATCELIKTPIGRLPLLLVCPTCLVPRFCLATVSAARMRKRGCMNAKQSRLVLTSLLLMVTGIAGSSPAGRHNSTPAIPPGLELQARIIDRLSSESANAGDTFQGTLATAIVVNGRVLYPKGSNVSGQVTAVHRSGRLSDPGVLELVLTAVSSGGMSSSLATEPFLIKGASHTKNNVAKIGGGTAAGAIIGGILGGGKGAAIGAGVGAGAGTATAATTGKKPATVEPEAVLTFLTSSDRAGSVAHSSEPSANGDGDRDDDRFRSRDNDSGYSFGERDREVLQGCLSSYDFESLPPGIQKKLARGGTLPPGQAKKLRSLPDSCTERLPRLPRGVSRIIFGDRVILIDGGNRILDILIF